MGLDLSGNGSSETMYDEGDRNLAVSNSSVVDYRSRRAVLSPLHKCQQMSCLTMLGVEMQAVEVDAQKHQHTQASLDGL